MGAGAPPPKPPSAFQSPCGGGSGGFGPNGSGFGGGHDGYGDVFGSGDGLGNGNGAAGAHSHPKRSSPLKRTLGGQQKSSSPTKMNHLVGQGQGLSFDGLDEDTEHVIAVFFAESLRLAARNKETQRRNMDVDGTKRVVEEEDDEGKQQTAKQGEGVTGMGI